MLDITMNRICIIMPTYQHCDDFLKPALESIFKYTKFRTNEYEIDILVVANGCTDNTQEYIDNLKKNSEYENVLNYLWFEDFLGYTKATNRGIEYAINHQYDMVLLLNNDIIIQESYWLDILLKQMNYHPKVGISGVIGDMDPQVHYIVTIFFCTLIKIELFKELGLLDEIYSPGFGEDTQFCVNAREKGWLIMNTIFQKENQSLVFPIYHKSKGKMCDKNLFQNWIVNSQILIDRYMKPDTFRWSKIFNEVTCNNSYRVNTKEIQNKIVIDIGANVGAFTSLAAEIGAKKVIGYEPIQANYNQLIENTKIYPNVQASNLAVYSDVTTVTMVGSGEHATIGDGQDYVMTTTLEDIFNSFPEEKSFTVKLDCEGSEFDILYSASKKTLEKIDTIYMEIHEDAKKERIAKHMDTYLKYHGFKQTEWHELYWFPVNGQPFFFGTVMCKFNRENGGRK